MSEKEIRDRYKELIDSVDNKDDLVELLQILGEDETSANDETRSLDELFEGV